MTAEPGYPQDKIETQADEPLVDLSGTANDSQVSLTSNIQRIVEQSIVVPDMTVLQTSRGTALAALRIVEGVLNVDKPGPMLQKRAWVIMGRGLGLYPKDITEQSKAIFDKPVGQRIIKGAFSEVLVVRFS